MSEKYVKLNLLLKACDDWGGHTCPPHIKEVDDCPIEEGTFEINGFHCLMCFLGEAGFQAKTLEELNREAKTND